MQIVLADPSRAVRRIITQLIEAAGHQVHGFGDGQEALDCVSSNREVRALITSAEPANMPGVKLCAAARHMVGDRRPLYIILMSSLDDHDLVVQALDNGADDFIRKPPVAEELRARLRVADRVTSMQRELIRHANTDYLTGLLNRRAFFERAVETCNRMNCRKALSVVLFDVDHFKRVNDTHGHDVGDIVLSAIATQANAVDGTTARLGGEEFCVLRECDLTDATEMAEALRQSMRRLRFKNHRGLSVTCSFGVAEWESGDTIDLLLRRADVALYEAKTTGRDRVIASDSFPSTERHDGWRGVARAARRARS